MAVNWEYYDAEEFSKVNDKYLPFMGEGETMATQIVTAVNKLVYRWYNDGDVFDNTHYLHGWCNNLSSYANWLDKYAGAGEILAGIGDCYNGGDYENLLKELADKYLDDEYLDTMKEKPLQGSIYDCDGYFKFEELTDEEEEDDYWY